MIFFTFYQLKWSRICSFQCQSKCSVIQKSEECNFDSFILKSFCSWTARRLSRLSRNNQECQTAHTQIYNRQSTTYIDRLSPHLEGSVCPTKTLTPAAWIRGLNSTALHSDQLLMSPCHLCVSSMMSVTCLFHLCSLYKLVSFSVPPTLHTARLGRSVLCSGLRRARGARAMPPHVHLGWKVRTLRTERSGLLEKTRLLCSACLSLGKGWHWGVQGVRIGEKDRGMTEKD